MDKQQVIQNIQEIMPVLQMIKGFLCESNNIYIWNVL